MSKILSIEDDHFISEMYARALRKAGYEVEEVATGPDGLAEAKTGEYQLILLDIFIPEKTGIEVLHELRGDEGDLVPNSKIVIMTNYAQDEESRELIESKVDGYFIKADITPRTLVSLVEQLIGAPDANQQA